ncbi:MAG: hypothetical protein ACIARQ_13800 [Phycisphaerales bacterium JB061]|jgi:hypothetical protein
MARRLIIPLAAFLACVGACTPTTATQGYHDIRANWWSPSLEAELPMGYRAADIAAAAEGALVRMGYTITERTETEDRAIVVGEPAQAGPVDKIIVRASASGRRFVVRITTRPVGNEDRARITLDEMLVLLGL